LPDKTPEPALQAVREALRAILLLKKAVDTEQPDERLDLWHRAETALYESAWQTRQAVGQELHDPTSDLSAR
jgi:hypothetical protein